MASRRKEAQKGLPPAAAGAVALGSAVVGVVTGWIVYSNVGIDHQVPLAPAVRATREEFTAPGVGRLSVYQDTASAGTPLVLLHSINAAASAYEMRPLFEYYRGQRPVYALDLPGYGFSERRDRVYTPELFTYAILALLERIRQPADVIALSLTSEFAAQVARQAPDHVRSLTLISPTGFSDSRRKTGSRVNSTRSNMAHDLLSIPLWARPLYDLIATRGSIRYFLQKSFTGPVPDAMVDYAYATSHQPDAHHAPLAFLSGVLFTPHVRLRVYDNLTLPVLVIYDQDPYVNFSELPSYVDAHANWQARRVSPTHGLPHYEQLGDTTRALDRFWEQV